MKYKILMTLMGLNIGGAETHVVELSKELHKKGYEIIVASNGGVYEKELMEAGIKHYNVPMNKRNIFKMKKSYKLLKDIIEKENVDIVHSHARIPSFICGKLHKKMGFPFVTSAHWVFYTGMGLKYLTDWGQKVIAVSDDIKQYLMDNYKIPERDIFVTINGIDTDKFSPETDGSKIADELSLKDDELKLVYVSRMDESRALVARQLIEITPDLVKEIPNIKLIIVGGGDVFDDLLKKSQEVNKKLGRDVIVMTGGRTDINELVSVADIFVGVSRAALEAMAAAKPVIIAGNEGYIGIFGKDSLDVAMKTNFCCRGCEESSERLLLRDVVYLLKGISDEDRKHLGDYGRQVIFDNYSVSKMADICIEAYDAVIRYNQMPKANILMSGYYGFNNTGDEAIMLAMHKNISELSERINIMVLSRNPAETHAKYGINATKRFNFFGVASAISKCDILLSGGGSLLQDRTSTRSLLYYLSIIWLAKFRGKKVMLYANGIGPVIKKANQKRVKNMVNKADVVTLREENSLQELQAMGFRGKEVHVTADPVFTLEGIPKEKALEIMKESGIPTDKPIIGVSVRKWYNVDNFAEGIAALCDEIYEKLDRNIVFIVMQNPNDRIISESIRKKMREPSYILKGNCSPYELMGIIGTMEAILSMRLHTLIFAAKQRVPSLGFVYDPKIDYYLEKLSMPSGGQISDFDKELCFEKVKDIVAERDKYVEVLDKATTSLEEMAPMNDVYLMKLLNERK
ncbi:MAG: polysaccharide pyruvyl transferase CsaB [Firmicutes bacterium]|nr:polysaccharide pyruvyl transferase CsaB [Bacillota bacterium]